MAEIITVSSGMKRDFVKELDKIEN